MLREADAAPKADNTAPAIVLYEKVARHYESRGFALKAIAVWKQIANVAPDRLDARLHLAELLATLGLIEDARAEFRIVIVRTSNPDLKNRATKGLSALAPS